MTIPGRSGKTQCVPKVAITGDVTRASSRLTGQALRAVHQADNGRSRLVYVKKAKPLPILQVEVLKDELDLLLAKLQPFLRVLQKNSVFVEPFRLTLENLMHPAQNVAVKAGVRASPRPVDVLLPVLPGLL